MADVPEGAFRWTSAACTDVGRVRKENEDACLDRPAQRLWAVADGMGGHACGAYASRVVVEALGRVAADGDLPARVDAARQRLQEANALLQAEAARRSLRVIGSTAVILLAEGRRCGCLWAGDSRLYLYRWGALRQVTRDHNLAEEFKSRMSQSRMNPDSDDAAPYPARNLLTRAVGAAENLEIDNEWLEVEDGDVFLLCSDGLSNELGEPEICAALAIGSCRQAADTLVRCALQRGGRDNVTALVVRADEDHRADETVVNPAFSG